MTRPESYREQSGRYCGNCRFLGVVDYFQRFCFRSDEVEFGEGYIILNGSEIRTSPESCREGLDARAVNTSDTCDKWSPEE